MCGTTREQLKEMLIGCKEMLVFDVDWTSVL